MWIGQSRSVPDRLPPVATNAAFTLRATVRSSSPDHSRDHAPDTRRDACIQPGVRTGLGIGMLLRRIHGSPGPAWMPTHFCRTRRRPAWPTRRATRRHEPRAQDAAALHEAALAYVARYAATEAGLLRVLLRRIDRWSREARDAGAERDAIEEQTVTAAAAARDAVARLAAAGAINDAAFAESRVRSSVRAGRSHRAIEAHLAAKGVGAEAQRRILPSADADFRAGRRAGAGTAPPCRSVPPGEPPDAEGQRRELAIFARAGFPQGVAQRALAFDPAEAEALVNQLRR